MRIYTELFFNNIENFIRSAFPIFHSLFTPAEWLSLVRDFFSEHRSQTPYFLEICEEFLDYLSQEHLPIHGRFPFAQELCHYEWLELALDVGQAAGVEDLLEIDDATDLLNVSIGLSPLLALQVYAWPVHEIGPENIPCSASVTPNCLLLYRAINFKVEFVEINPATLRLLQLIQEQPGVNTQVILHQLADELAQPCNENFCAFAVEILQKMRSLGVVLGAYSL
jgi:hypothetical protein